METIVRQHLNIRDSKIVAVEVNKTLERINEFVKKNDYLYKENDSEKNPCGTETPASFMSSFSLLESHLKDASLKKKKVLRRYMRRIEFSPSLLIVNKFLHFLYKVILKTDYRKSVVKGELEEKIQAKRQAYLAALAIAKAAHQDYKTTKGDFYKKRLK